MSIHLTVRMAAPSIVISLLLLTVGGVGGWYVDRLQRNTAKTVSLDMATIQAAEQLVFAIGEMRMELAQFLATNDRAHLDAVPAACEHIERWLVAAEALVDDNDEIAVAGRIRAGYAKFVVQWQKLPLAAPLAEMRQAVARLNDEVATNDLLAPTKELIALEERLNRTSSEKNQAMADRVAWGLWLLGVCGAVAGLVAGFGIARGISHSIVNLYVPIRAASGRLEEVIGPVDIAPAKGIEHLDEILRSMANQVGTVVDRLQQSQHEVLHAEQMSALGQLAAGLAHELRNPLTSLKLLVQAAVEAGPDAALRGRDLAVVADETARLDRSLQTFLDFARPPRLEKRRADVLQVLNQTLELVSARAARQGVSIRSAVSAAALDGRGRPRAAPPGVSQPDAQCARRTAARRRDPGHRRRRRGGLGDGRRRRTGNFLGTGRSGLRTLREHEGFRFGARPGHLPPHYRCAWRPDYRQQRS